MKRCVLGFIFALLLVIGALAARPVSDVGVVAAQRAAACQSAQPDAQPGSETVAILAAADGQT